MPGGPSCRLGAAVLAALVAAAPAAADPVAEPDGYRMEDFRAPVPATLAGARVVSTAQVREFVEAGTAVLIDVLPRPPRPDALGPGTIWRPKPRRNIPGSVWLANTGFGALAPAVEAYFRRNLASLTAGDPARPLVFYCLADCWMSWNAAKRAVSYGYTAVLWYPEGTDGWAAEGLPLAPSDPVPMAAPAQSR